MAVSTTSALAEGAAELEVKLLSVLRELVESRVASKVIWDPSLKLTNLGLDSMKKVALAFRIEELFQLDLSAFQDKLLDIETLGDVRALVAEALRNS